jgi:hypothetical protein
LADNFDHGGDGLFRSFDRSPDNLSRLGLDDSPAPIAAKETAPTSDGFNRIAVLITWIETHANGCITANADPCGGTICRKTNVCTCIHVILSFGC